MTCAMFLIFKARGSSQPSARVRARYGAVLLLFADAIAEGMPEATTRPPSSPAPGPMSMTQSLCATSAISCSTTSTVLPPSTKPLSCFTSFSTSEGCSPVVGHALAQRGDVFRAHRQLLSWMRLTTPRSSRQDTPPATDDPHPGYRARRQAARLSGLSRSDLVRWHIASFIAARYYGSDRGNSGHGADIAEVKRLTHLGSGVCVAAVLSR